MAIVDLAALEQHLSAKARLMGLDFGDKTIGMAVSDRGRTVASPVGTIQRTKFTADARALSAAIAERSVKALVIGLPVGLNGQEGKRCQATRQFARNLIAEAGYTLPIAFWDERLSTAAVERVLSDEAEMAGHKHKQHLDQMAAAYILQGALDALRRG
ncbi:Holliday junction resolvase RuvX [Rhodovibrio sodomensis]|uniref:Putative pre-16S rRNA nuclease n=1 Tax=Rhodovibrio sodomensis TaxID=1088 RepID=A0ABS1D9Y5_9PROT|nr:Holliday junction resolvase RuvX [Rhodovibrio sodomensis]MBK1667227.1 Holliday junction resolvase RuvX [Rhodovibrio sodomensis]